MEKVIRVHPSLEEELRKIRCDIDRKFKRKLPPEYKRLNVRLPANASSYILARKLKKENRIKFKIIKTGRKEGRVELF